MLARELQQEAKFTGSGKLCIQIAPGVAFDPTALHSTVLSGAGYKGELPARQRQRMQSSSSGRWHLLTQYPRAIWISPIWGPVGSTYCVMLSSLTGPSAVRRRSPISARTEPSALAARHRSGISAISAQGRPGGQKPKA